MFGEKEENPEPEDDVPTHVHTHESDHGTDDLGAVGGQDKGTSPKLDDGTNVRSLQSVPSTITSLARNCNDKRATATLDAGINDLCHSVAVEGQVVRIRKPETVLEPLYTARILSVASNNGRDGGCNESVSGVYAESEDHCIRSRPEEVFKDVHPRNQNACDVMNPSVYRPTIGSAFRREQLVFVMESDEKCESIICTSSSSKSTFGMDCPGKKKYYATYQNELVDYQGPYGCVAADGAEKRDPNPEDHQVSEPRQRTESKDPPYMK